MKDEEGESFGSFANGTREWALARAFRDWVNESASDEALAAAAEAQGMTADLEEEIR